MPNKPPVLAIDARLYWNRSWAWRIATATVDRFVSEHSASYSKIVLFAHSRKVFDALPDGWNVKKVLINCHFLLGKLFLVPFWLLAHRAGVYFSPTSELPVWKPFGTKYVNMVHDLFMEEILDESTGRGRGLIKAIRYFIKARRPLETFYLTGLFGYAFSIANATIAISVFSKDDAVARYGLSEKNISVIPVAADERYFEDYSIDEALKKKLESKFDIVGKYVFTYDAVGDFESFSQIASESCFSKGLNWVILNRHEDVYVAFKRAKTEDNVVFIRDFVTDEDLVDMIRASEFVFFPSPWEGFWIPIAECLASGKTVLAPGITAIPEVGGKRVTCYDPNDSEDIRLKFEAILESYGGFKNPRDTAFVQRYRWKAFTSSLNDCLSEFIC